MDAFTLTIPAGLDQSILLGVLIGLLVLLLLTESFGWSFVGAAVPGYLSSVFIIEPATGLAVCFDAAVTYVIVRTLMYVIGRTEAGTTMFGRDRFFFVVLISVLVRQQSESWLTPMISLALGLPQVAPEFAAALNGIGLVLVPLTANALWKLDLRRGTMQLGVTVGVTFVVTEFILLGNTSLSYSAFAVNFENAALDFLGNAKVYILLLSGAYLASATNLRYGWDFGGILVPALLTLLWLSPVKLATTVAEALVLAAVYRGIERAPGFRRLSLEGPRRLVIVFFCGILLKWVLGIVVGERFPHFRVTDLYGFGYLLPSLLALRIVLRRSARRVITTTLLTSGAGFVVGSVAGFALQLLVPTPAPTERAATEGAAGGRLAMSPEGIALLGYARASEPSVAAASYGDLVAYDAAWAAIGAWLHEPTEQTRELARRRAAAAGLRLQALPGRASEPAFSLVEAVPDGNSPRGYDVAALFPARHGPIVFVDQASNGRSLCLSAAAACDRLRCRALVIGGPNAADQSEPRSASIPTELAVARLGAFGYVSFQSDEGLADRAIVHVDRQLPDELDLRNVWDRESELSWDPPPSRPAPWGRGSSGLTVRVSAQDLRQRVADEAPPLSRHPNARRWLMQRDDAPELRNVAPPAPPHHEELRLLESLVEQLLRPQILDEPHLALIAAQAAPLGYGLVIFDQCLGPDRCIALTDEDARVHAGWGSILVREGGDPTFAIAVPRPHRNPGTRGLGFSFWGALNARALVVAGADTDEGAPPADPMAQGNIGTFFHAAHQAIDTDMAAHDGGIVLQVAGYSPDRQLSAPVVVGLGTPSADGDALPEPLAGLFRSGGGLGFVGPPQLASGAPHHYALSGSGSAQIAFSEELGVAKVAILWFSPEIRARFVRRDHRRALRDAARLGIAVDAQDDDVARLIGRWADAEPLPASVWTEVISLAEAYARTQNIRTLKQLLDTVSADPRISFGLAFGSSNGRPYLWLQAHRATAMVRLDERSEERLSVDRRRPESVRAALWSAARTIVTAEETSP